MILKKIIEKHTEEQVRLIADHRHLTFLVFRNETINRLVVKLVRPKILDLPSRRVEIDEHGRVLLDYFDGRTTYLLTCKMPLCNRKRQRKAVRRAKRKLLELLAKSAAQEMLPDDEQAAYWLYLAALHRLFQHFGLATKIPVMVGTPMEAKTEILWVDREGYTAGPFTEDVESGRPALVLEPPCDVRS